MDLKKGYYQADTANGVQYYDVLMDLDVDIMSTLDFYESLDTLEDNKTIYTFFDRSEQEMYDKIKKEYGINQ
jgi:hypothetical protein